MKTQNTIKVLSRASQTPKPRKEDEEKDVGQSEAWKMLIPKGYL